VGAWYVIDHSSREMYALVTCTSQEELARKEWIVRIDISERNLKRRLNGLVYTHEVNDSGISSRSVMMQCTGDRMRYQWASRLAPNR
jgi:hypothetical protein